MFGLVISDLIKFILSFAYLGQLSMKWSMVSGCSLVSLLSGLCISFHLVDFYHFCVGIK